MKDTDTYCEKKTIKRLYIPLFVFRIPIVYDIKKLMVEPQTFTTSDYLLKNSCFGNNKLQNRKKKWDKNNLIILNKQKYNFKVLRTCSD